MTDNSRYYDIFQEWAVTDNSRYYDIFNCAAGAVYHEEGAAVADEVGVDAVVEAVRADVAHHIETRAAGYEPHVIRVEVAARIAREGLE